MQRDPIRALLVVLFLVSLFLGTLAGCGGGGGSPGQTDTTVQLQSASAGSLAVTIAGQPPGLPAVVQVAGPNKFVAELTQSQTLSGLAPGSYALTALPLVSGPQTWVPAPATQTVSVASGAAASARIDYALAPTQPAMPP